MFNDNALHYITVYTWHYHPMAFHTIPSQCHNYQYHVIPNLTIPHFPVPYPYHSIPYQTAPYHTNTMPYHHTTPYHTVTYLTHTIPYHTIPYYNISTYHTRPHHTTPCHTDHTIHTITLALTCFLVGLFLQELIEVQIAPEAYERHEAMPCRDTNTPRP